MSSVPVMLLNFADGELKEVVSDSSMRVLWIDEGCVQGHCYEMTKPDNPSRLAKLLADALAMRQERFEGRTNGTAEDSHYMPATQLADRMEGRTSNSPIVALKVFDGHVREVVSDSEPENPRRLAALLADALLVREETHEVVTEIKEKGTSTES